MIGTDMIKTYHVLPILSFKVACEVQRRSADASGGLTHQVVLFQKFSRELRLCCLY